MADYYEDDQWSLLWNPQQNGGMEIITETEIREANFPGFGQSTKKKKKNKLSLNVNTQKKKPKKIKAIKKNKNKKDIFDTSEEEDDYDDDHESSQDDDDREELNVKQDIGALVHTPTSLQRSKRFNFNQEEDYDHQEKKVEKYKKKATLKELKAAKKLKDQQAAVERLKKQKEFLSTICFNNIRTIMKDSVPEGTRLQCTITRFPSLFGKTKYVLSVSHTGKFLLNAKKRRKNRTANYAISMDRDGFDPKLRGYLGKLRSNFVGTHFVLYDDGVKPTKDRKQWKHVELKQNKSDGPERKQLLVIHYEKNVFGTRGPRKLCVVQPNQGYFDHDMNSIFKDYTDKMIKDLDQDNCPVDDSLVMKNKAPKWNPKIQAHVLNFKGRVTIASVKNFQLVDQRDSSKTLLQFGKTGKNTFNLDFTYPYSIFQAFSVALSALDSKLGCE